jgi:hypothetical protein
MVQAALDDHNVLGSVRKGEMPAVAAVRLGGPLIVGQKRA